MEANLTMPEELIDTLEENGEISMTDGVKELFIQSVDDKEGYSYVRSTNEEFGSRKAVKWAITLKQNKCFKDCLVLAH